MLLFNLPLPLKTNVHLHGPESRREENCNGILLSLDTSRLSLFFSLFSLPLVTLSNNYMIVFEWSALYKAASNSRIEILFAESLIYIFAFDRETPILECYLEFIYAAI